MRLDRDPALALEVHRIEQLILPFAVLNRARALQQTIRKRGLAVIDMRDDAEIARQLEVGEATPLVFAFLFGQFTFAMCRGRNEDAAPLAQLSSSWRPTSPTTLAASSATVYVA